MKKKIIKHLNTAWTWGTYWKFSAICIIVSLVVNGWTWHKYFGWEPKVLTAIKQWRKERSEKKTSQREMFHDVYSREEVKD